MPANVAYVDVKTIQRLFNEGDYVGKVDTGEYIETIVHEAPAHPKYKQPPGTQTQTVEYREANTGQWRGRAHRFVMPSGKVGASGKPDPKLIRQGGVTYAIDPEPHRWWRPGR
jgi:hypothetical protein